MTLDEIPKYCNYKFTGFKFCLEIVNLLQEWRGRIIIKGT